MAAKCDNIMTINTLTGHCKIFKSTFYKLVVENKLPSQNIDKRWRFHKGAINEWLKQHPEKGVMQ